MKEFNLNEFYLWKEQRSRMDYIKADDLKNGYLYRISARHGQYGIWFDNEGEFILSRHKFGENFLFGEIHWDLSDNHGTAKAFTEIEKTPYTTEDMEKTYKNNKSDMLRYLNEYEDALTELEDKVGRYKAWIILEKQGRW